MATQFVATPPLAPTATASPGLSARPAPSPTAARRMVLDQMLTGLHSQEPEEDVLSPEFRRQLDGLEVKCAEDRATLLGYAISTREALVSRGVWVRLLDILTELNQGISDDTEDEICKDAFDLYAELHTGG